jgi:hypothetical protein
MLYDRNYIVLLTNITEQQKLPNNWKKNVFVCSINGMLWYMFWLQQFT